MKKRAYLVFTVCCGNYEFYGVHPVRRSDIVERLSESVQAFTEERLVTRTQLEDIMDDEVTDAEWEEYKP